MHKNKIKTQTSIVAGTGFALLSTTCCALPIALVSLGFGGAVASMFSTLPWLATIGKYKLWLFIGTGILLAYSWLAVHRLGCRMATKESACHLDDQKILKRQKCILWIATVLLLISVFAAYALLPIQVWFDEVLNG